MIVAQLAEHRVVVPKVAGSSPVGHPPVEVPVDETARVRFVGGDTLFTGAVGGLRP